MEIIIIIGCAILVLFLLVKNKDKILPRSPRNAPPELRNYPINYPEPRNNPPNIIWEDRTIPPETTPRNTRNETANITWRDISNDEHNTNSSPLREEIWELFPDEIETEKLSNFLDFTKNDPIEKVLNDLIDCRDPFSQEKFKNGDEIYFCSHCTLAYHKDSWEEMGKKCSSCHNDNHTKLYTLPNNH